MKRSIIYPAVNYDPKDDLLQEFADTIKSLLEENTLLRDKISVGQFNATEVEKIEITQRLEELRKANERLEIDNRALTDSRNWFQNQAAQTIGSRNYWEKQAKKAQKLLDLGGQNV
jgi:hypothetical protein